MREAAVRENLRRIYDGYYAGHDAAWRELCAKHKAANIMALCVAVPHTTIVDIGAGDGAVAAVLAAQRFADDLHCLEVSSSGVDAIRKRGIPGGLVSQFDGYHMSFPDKTFDLGIASHVLEHVEHERVFLSEACRVCRYLFVEVPLEDTVRLPIDHRPSDVGHINFYSFKTIRRLLQTCGLEVLDQRLLDIPLDVHRYESGWRGIGKFAVRRAAAMVSKRLASRVFTFHCALLCACP
jgi:ubiquinone/menaquinone biosynthesis C-methylase UbiE